MDNELDHNVDVEDDTDTKEVSEEKLQEWDNPPTVANLKADYLEGKTDFDLQVASIDKWLELLKAPNIDTPAGKSAIQPKLVRKQAEWRYSALSEPFLSTPELFNLSPVTYEDRKAAYQNGVVLNHQFNNEIPKVKFIGDLVRTGVNEGTAIIRVGWEEVTEEEEVEEEVFTYRDAITEEELDVIKGVMQAGAEDPSVLRFNPEMAKSFEASKLNNRPIIATATGEMEQTTVINTIVNRPTVEVCDYANVMIDPTCNGNMDKANFVIYTYETSRAELEAKGSYKNLDAVNWKGNSATSDSEYSRTNASEFTFKDKARKRVVAHEYWGYWDIHDEGTLTPIVATYIGDVMIQLEENPFPDKKLPFVVVPYLPVKGSVYGHPDAVLLEDNQKIIGAVTRGMIDIMARSANGQTAHRQDALDPVNKAKMIRGEDFEFQGNANAADVFYMHKYPEIPRSAEYMLGLQNAEAESLTGIKAFSSGISGQALGSTATGVRSALDATSKRELDILRRFSAALEEVGRKIIAMNAEFLSDEEVVRITNDEYLTIRRDELVGKFDIKIAISTPESDEQKAQDLGFLLQTTGQTLGPQFTQLILTEIARLKRQPDLAKRIEEFQPQPDPLEEKRKELELRLLEIQIGYEEARANKQNASGQLDIARIGTEQAKQRNLGSDSDLKDLDYLNKDSGAEQAQELQRIEETTQGQMRITELSNRLKSLGDAGNQRTPTTYNGVEQV